MYYIICMDSCGCVYVWYMCMCYGIWGIKLVLVHDMSIPCRVTPSYVCAYTYSMCCICVKKSFCINLFSFKKDKMWFVLMDLTVSHTDSCLLSAPDKDSNKCP